MMLSVPDRGRSEIARDRRKCEQNQTFDSIRVTIVAYGEAKTFPQAIICKKPFGSGFPPRIRRSITTSRVNPIMGGQQLGSPKVTSTWNGRHKARLHGFTGNVCSPPLRVSDAADNLWSHSWVGEERSLVRHPSTGTV